MADSKFSEQVLVIFTPASYQYVLSEGKSWVRAVLEKYEISGDVTFFFPDDHSIGLLVDLNDLETSLSVSFLSAFRNYMDTSGGGTDAYTDSGIPVYFSSYLVTPDDESQVDLKISYKPLITAEMVRHYA